MNDLFNAIILNIDPSDVIGKTLIYNFVDKIDDRLIMDYKAYKYDKKKEALQRKKIKLSRVLQDTERKIDNLANVVTEVEIKSENKYVIMDKVTLGETKDLRETICKIREENDVLQKDIDRLNRNERSMRLFYESRHHQLSEIKEEEVIIKEDDHRNDMDDELADIKSIKNLIDQLKIQNDQTKSSLIESADPVKINIVVKVDEFTKKQKDIIESLSTKLLYQENLSRELQIKLKELDEEEAKFQSDMSELNKYRSIGKLYAAQVKIEEIPALDAIKKYYLIESRYRSLISECEKLIPETVNFESTWNVNIKENGRAYAIRSLIEYYRIRMRQLLKDG